MMDKATYGAIGAVGAGAGTEAGTGSATGAVEVAAGAWSFFEFLRTVSDTAPPCPLAVDDTPPAPFTRVES